jgi:hypothetical protein
VTFRQKQITLDTLSQPEWEDATDYSREKDKQYGASELSVPAIVQSQADDDAVEPAQTTCGDHMECVEIIPRIIQMPQGLFRPASCLMRLGLVKPESETSISIFSLLQSMIRRLYSMRSLLMQ